jgi:ABC-type Fe3+/spermidine/putrescine transport system ATPase subunit
MAVKADAVAHGPLTLRVAGGGLVPGAHVALSIRPHQIELVDPSAPPAPGVNALRGIVQRVSFLGETVDYQVAVVDTDLVLRVAAPAIRRLPASETVGLRIDPAACVVLADG